MSDATPRPVVVKTCRQKAVITGIICLLLAVGLCIRIAWGLPTGVGWVLEPFAALFMIGCALYLFAIAVFRPVALRMDVNGISGYYAPPPDMGRYRHL